MFRCLFSSAVEISAMAVVGDGDSIPTVLSLLNVVVFGDEKVQRLCFAISCGSVTRNRSAYG